MAYNKLQRQNGGRRPGAATKITRRKANEINASDESPLDVMIDNMRFWWRQAKDVGARLEALVVNADSPEERQAAMQMVKQFLASRENAQRCAVEAAPYVHPRLQSIQANVTVRKSLEQCSDDELAGFLAEPANDAAVGAGVDSTRVESPEGGALQPDRVHAVH